MKHIVVAKIHDGISEAMYVDGDLTTFSGSVNPEDITKSSNGEPVTFSHIVVEDFDGPWPSRIECLNEFKKPDNWGDYFDNLSQPAQLKAAKIALQKLIDLNEVGWICNDKHVDDCLFWTDTGEKLC